MTPEEAAAFEKKHANMLTKEGVVALREKVARGAALDTADATALLDTLDVVWAWAETYRKGWDEASANHVVVVQERQHYGRGVSGRRDGRSKP